MTKISSNPAQRKEVKFLHLDPLWAGKEPILIPLRVLIPLPPLTLPRENYDRFGNKFPNLDFQVPLLVIVFVVGHIRRTYMGTALVPCDFFPFCIGTSKSQKISFNGEKF